MRRVARKCRVDRGTERERVRGLQGVVSAAGKSTRGRSRPRERRGISAQADGVVFVGRDAEVEMERVGWNPRGDFFGPLDGEAPGRIEKIFEEEGFDLGGGFEAVGVEVDERAR